MVINILIQVGIDRPLLTNITEEILQHTCNITNPVHRMKLMAALSGNQCNKCIDIC